MSHTNSTTNYALPQFITTDKPAWLTDINNAFLAIDTGMDTAQDAADAAQGDATQALTDAGNAATAAATADAKGAGAVASIEAAFDATAVYAIGAKVMYNNLLYRCNVAVVTPGPWTGSANWERITIIPLIPETAGDLPLGSDFSDPTKTAGAIKALENATATSATSTIIVNNSNVTSTQTNALKKKNDMVCLDYVFLCKALTDFKSKTWGTLPSGYMPATNMRVVATFIPDYTSANGTTKVLMIEINTSGEIRCTGGGNYSDLGSPTANTQINIHTCYYV